MTRSSNVDSSKTKEKYLTENTFTFDGAIFKPKWCHLKTTNASAITAFSLKNNNNNNNSKLAKATYLYYQRLEIYNVHRYFVLAQWLYSLCDKDTINAKSQTDVQRSGPSVVQINICVDKMVVVVVVVVVGTVPALPEVAATLWVDSGDTASMSGWLAGWLAGRLAGWLAGWLAFVFAIK
uniref:Uncharacterized protein n=1 Tax=Glossina brevipalpis TaxID=37001 RepID=A0A1A9WMK0_9MUSC